MTPGTQSRGDGSSSSMARSDIDATRERMGDTLEELGARLNPQRLKQQAKNKVREATIGRVQTMAQTTKDKATSAGRKVTDVVRENPIPAALIAAGISWFVWSSRRGGSSPSVSDYESEVSRNYSGSTDAETSFNESEATRKTEKVREKAGEVVDNVEDIAQRAKDTTKTAATNVADTARTQSDKLASAFQSNPLPLGLIATALGLAAGLAIPSTQKESELVGEKRHELVDKAREIVSEKKQQVKRVAKRVVSEAKSTATQAAKEEGLTGAP